MRDWPIADLDGGEELDTMPRDELVVVLPSFNRPYLWFRVLCVNYDGYDWPREV